jgi:hypothetical protein
VQSGHSNQSPQREQIQRANVFTVIFMINNRISSLNIRNLALTVAAALRAASPVTFVAIDRDCILDVDCCEVDFDNKVVPLGNALTRVAFTALEMKFRNISQNAPHAPARAGPQRPSNVVKLSVDSKCRHSLYAGAGSFWRCSVAEPRREDLR